MTKAFKNMCQPLTSGRKLVEDQHCTDQWVLMTYMILLYKSISYICFCYYQAKLNFWTSLISYFDLLCYKSHMSKTKQNRP